MGRRKGVGGPPVDQSWIDELGRKADEVLRRSAELVGVASRPVRESTTIRPGHKLAPSASAFSIQAASANSKLAPQREVLAANGRTRYEPIGPYCASTYCSISATCPSVCPFKDNGCFAQAGASHLTMGKLDRAGRRTTGLEVSQAEAYGLERLWVRGVPQDGHRGGRDLRLHVGGDVSCEQGARALARAVEGLRARGLGAAWTYTHRWREIPRDAFGPISVLASCERPIEAHDALALGYAPAITVEAFPGRRAFDLGYGVKAIPCPFEALGKGRPTCVECRLCFDDARLRSSRRAIGFAVHGSQSEAAKGRLRVLNGGEA